MVVVVVVVVIPPTLFVFCWAVHVVIKIVNFVTCDVSDIKTKSTND